MFEWWDLVIVLAIGAVAYAAQSHSHWSNRDTALYVTGWVGLALLAGLIHIPIDTFE